MPLPTGQWNAIIDGAEQPVLIEAVDGAGEIRGTLGGLPFIGLWSEIAQRISFATVGQFARGLGGGPMELDITAKTRYFTGCLMRSPQNAPAGADLTWTLAGTFEAGPRIGGDARRTSFAWYATIKQVV